MKTFLASLAFIFPLLGANTIDAGDGFEAVRCGSDIPKALIGHKGSDEPVVKIEERHKDISLKHLGADEISESLNIIFWQICGDEYVTLEAGVVVKDALKFPTHSKDTPQFDGFCQLNGKELPEAVVGVLKNEEGATMLQALSAWKIDEKQKKFVQLQTEGLVCDRNGITTEDGGK